MKNNRFKVVRMVLLIILVLNLGVAAAKIVMGLLIKSASMFADGVHSITDGSSNIIGIIGISLASAPRDEEHPYGHKKIETLTSLFIVAMLVFLGFKIVMDALPRFASPEAPEVTIASLAVMVITFVINLFVTMYEHKKGVELNSTILISDAMHTRSDLYVTIGVLTTLVALRLGAPAIIDPIASIIVAGFILKAALEIFQEASRVLIDSSVVDSKLIKEVAVKFKEVKDVHNIRSRGTRDDVHIDMHILADGKLTLEAVHDLGHRIEEAIQIELKCNAEVIIHAEPFAVNHKDKEI